MLDKLPGMGNMGNMAKQTDAAEKNFKQMEAIIRSMTPAERRNPDLINGSRKNALPQVRAIRFKTLIVC